MNTPKIKTYKLTLLVFSLLLLASCKTYLAPNYDQVIIDKSTEATTQTFQFFAAIVDGTNQESFATRENNYNTIIGQFETLKLLAKARPIPTNKTTERINKLLDQKNSPTTSNNYPSAFAFKRIVENLVKMKATDKKSGLNPTVIQAFKGEIEIFIDQAITYESFLKR